MKYFIKVMLSSGELLEIDCWDLPMGLNSEELQEWLTWKIGEEMDAKYCDEGPG